jgi:ABC-type Fe3+ transport system substrate-binding protein
MPPIPLVRIGLAGALCFSLLACAGPSPASTGSAPPRAPAPTDSQSSAAGPRQAPPSSAAPAAVAAPTRSPAVQQLVDGARAEGELNLVLSPSYFDEGRAVGEFEQAFNAYFGLNTKLNRTVGPSMPQMANQIIQELQAGRAPRVDIFHGGDEHMTKLLLADALQPIDWRALDSSIPPAAIGEDNVALAYGTTFLGITYNQNLVSDAEVPRTMRAVLEPKWKNKVASTPYAAGFYRLALPNAWGEQATTDYARQLADHVGGLIRCGEYERLLSGEFQMLALDCGVQNVRRAKRAEIPLNFVIPADAILVSYYGFGVPRGSPHPNTATLFALFMYSEVGQRLSYQYDFMDLHLLPGSGTGELLTQLKAQGNPILGEENLMHMRIYAEETGRYEGEMARILAKQQ